MMNKLTEEQKLKIAEAKAKLIEASTDWDREAGHAHADDALCDILLVLGFDDIVDIFNDRSFIKWYA